MALRVLCWYQDDLYAPYLGQLAKLAFLASAVHQMIFTIFSTLPFAVGQVRLTSPCCMGATKPHGGILVGPYPFSSIDTWYIACDMW